MSHITLPRAVVEQVREALTCGDGESRHWCMHCDDHVPNSLGSLDILAALDAALAEPEPTVKDSLTVDAKREPATEEVIEAKFEKSFYVHPEALDDFAEGWCEAERFHGIRKEDGK